MKNFQDILLQKNIPYGPLWCDEGVYRIAKEIQLLKPLEFQNIFIGIGGFHAEKIVLASIGKYLEDSGAESIFVETEIFGPNTVKAVMSGGHYVRAKRGIRLLSEALNQLRLEQFLLSIDCATFEKLFKEVSEFQELFTNKTFEKSEVVERWNKCINLIPEFKELFAEFTRIESRKSDLFRYWSVFLDELFPIIKDLTNSFRERNWLLHLSAIRRAIPLFFVFDRVNYCRWMPIYFDDCLKLKENFPVIYDEFLKGDFSVQHSTRPFIAVPIDQALEKAYNKTAKGKVGIIGITAQKATIAKWNLIKHVKMQYIEYLSNLCDLNTENEYSLHHEFSGCSY